MGKKKKTGFPRLLELAGEKRVYLFASSFFAVASAGLALIPYIMIYILILHLFSFGFENINYSYVFKIGMFAAGGILLRYVFFLAAIMFSHVAAFNILYNLRSKITSHLGKLPMGFFTKNANGKIKKIMYEDVEEIELFIAHHIPDIAAGAALPLIVVGYLFTVDWKMALVSLLPLPIAFFMQQKAFDYDNMDKRRKKLHDSLENLNGTIVEYVRGMPVVKIFNRTVDSFSRLKEAAYSYTKYIKEITLAQAPPWAAFIVITSSGLFFILPFGLLFYVKGLITLPVFLLFMMMGSGYMAALIRLAMLGGQLGNILEGLKRIDDILDTPAIKESEKNYQIKDYSIEFRNVSFGYASKKVLENTSFYLEQGGLYALVGPSGAGKTTIAQLILRMWDVNFGEILVGGVGIKYMSRSKLMDLIGFVSQDVFMFSDSIYENIRMGKKDASYIDIENAAKAAQIYDFVKSLPKGFDTKIGEGGEVHLSGGEKQRISLARVILKNPPIVILDEATAYADAENESKIQAAFSEIMQGKTVIVIAHRLSTITDADEILVINNKCVYEKGRHHELIEQNSLYKNLWTAHNQAVSWTLSI